MTGNNTETDDSDRVKRNFRRDFVHAMFETLPEDAKDRLRDSSADSEQDER